MSYSQETIDFLHQGDFVSMKKALENAIQYDAEPVLSDLAEYLQMMGFDSESHQIYNHILLTHPEDTSILINLAELAEDDGELDKALDYLYRIPEDDENYVAGLVKIADLYQYEGDFETSISKLEEAKALSDDPLVTFALAESYFNHAEYQKAITEYAKLSERKILHHTKISIYQRIGEAYAQLGNFENAVSFLEKSFEFDKSDETQYKIAILYLEMNNISRALSTFKALHQTGNDLINYELAYAQALQENGQNQEAKKMAEKGLKKAPNSVMLLHFLSRLDYQLKDFSGAETQLMQALNLPEMHDETVFLLANLYFNQEDFEAVIRLEPLLEEQHLLAQWLFAQSYRALEEDEKANKAYQDLLETSLIENPEFLSDYIDYLREIGQIKAAKEYIKQYLEINPDDETMRNLLLD